MALLSQERESNDEVQLIEARKFRRKSRISRIPQNAMKTSTSQRTEVLSMLSVAESHTKILLKDHSNNILSEAQFELFLQERKAERANSSVQFLSDKLRSQC